MTYLLSVQVFIPIELLSGATVTFVSADYVVDESQSSVEVCTSLTDIPAGGLECEIVATMNTTASSKASMSPNVCYNSGRVLECMFSVLIEIGALAKVACSYKRWIFVKFEVNSYFFPFCAMKLKPRCEGHSV